MEYFDESDASFAEFSDHHFVVYKHLFGVYYTCANLPEQRFCFRVLVFRRANAALAQRCRITDGMLSPAYVLSTRVRRSFLGLYGGASHELVI